MQDKLGKELIGSINYNIDFAHSCELITQGANIRIQDAWGNTALHQAAYWGHFDLAKLLLENGSDKEIQNKEGYTPYQLARDQYFPDEYKTNQLKEIVKLLKSRY